MKKILLNPLDPKIHKQNGEVRSIKTKSLSRSNFDSDVITNVEVSQLAVSMAAQLDFGGLFSGKAEADYSFFLFEYYGIDPQLKLDSDGNNVALGYAMRIGIAVEKGSVKGNVSLSSLAAQATISGAKATCSAKFYGVDSSIFGELSSLLPNNATFDAEYVSKVGQGIGVIAESVAKGSGVNVEDQLPLYAVDIPSDNDFIYLQSVSTSFALKQITEGRSYNDAIQRKDQKVKDHKQDYYWALVNDATASIIYNVIMNGDLNSSPNKDQKNKAKAIYDKCWPK